ncbi:MAG: UMP kinase [Elusimicrobiota bacterium]|jgi:uridylate kinase|nr:UMP kinase [Elusimicrobiota bacterium]
MYKRALLKLSGETLSSGDSSISPNALRIVSDEIKRALETNHVELAIVLGAGNIWRGAQKDMDRVAADKIGMLATVMNSIALKDELIRNNLKAEVFCPSKVSALVKEYDNEKVIKYLKKGYITILAGGTGNPFFTTDSGAALRAAEIKADIVMKATQTDAIYSDDPKKNPKAVKFDKLSFNEALEKHLRIMDETAFALCLDANINILVFDFYKKGNLEKVLSGEKIGTIVVK